MGPMNVDGQLWAVEIPCPCCRETLVGSVISAGTEQLSRDFPPLRRDERGYFMRCPNCARRVAMDLVEMPPGIPAKVRVAEGQDCTPAIPE